MTAVSNGIGFVGQDCETSKNFGGFMCCYIIKIVNIYMYSDSHAFKLLNQLFQFLLRVIRQMQKNLIHYNCGKDIVKIRR